MTDTPFEHVTVTIDHKHGHKTAREMLLTNLESIPELPDSAIATELMIHGTVDRPTPETLVYVIALREEAKDRGLTDADLNKALHTRSDHRTPYVVAGLKGSRDWEFPQA